MDFERFKENFKQVYKLFRNPITNLRKVRNSDKLVKQRQGLDEKVVDLQTAFCYLEKGIGELQVEMMYAQREVEKKDKDTENLEEYIDWLKFENNERFWDLMRVKSEVKEALDTCNKVKTPLHQALAMAERNKGPNKELRDLEESKKYLERKARISGEQSAIFQGYAFAGRVNTYIHLDPKAKKIPITFYDYDNKEFYHNHVAEKLLKLGPGERYLSVSSLLEIIENEPYECTDPNINEKKRKKLNTKAKYLKNALINGIPLNSFEITTVGKKSATLHLTTRPIYYSSRVAEVTEKQHFGILMLFNKPSRNLIPWKRKVTIYEQVDEVLRGLKKEFEVIYEAVRYIK